MGIRLILIALAVWVLFIVVRRLFPSARRPTPPPGVQPVDMVRCVVCGTHLPKPEALHRHGKYFCSRAHLDAGGRNGEER